MEGAKLKDSEIIEDLLQLKLDLEKAETVI